MCFRKEYDLGMIDGWIFKLTLDLFSEVDGNVGIYQIAFGPEWNDRKEDDEYLSPSTDTLQFICDRIDRSEVMEVMKKHAIDTYDEDGDGFPRWGYLFDTDGIWHVLNSLPYRLKEPSRVLHLRLV